MKIKTKRLPYEKVMALPRAKHRDPLKHLFLLQLGQPQFRQPVGIRLIRLEFVLFSHTIHL